MSATIYETAGKLNAIVNSCYANWFYDRIIGYFFMLVPKNAANAQNTNLLRKANKLTYSQ